MGEKKLFIIIIIRNFQSCWQKRKNYTSKIQAHMYTTCWMFLCLFSCCTYMVQARLSLTIQRFAQVSTFNYIRISCVRPITLFVLYLFICFFFYFNTLVCLFKKRIALLNKYRNFKLTNYNQANPGRTWKKNAR